MGTCRLSKPNGSYRNLETGGERGAGDEEMQDEEVILEASSEAISSASFIGWMLTPEFHRHLLTYIPLDTLLTMKVLSKEFDETTRAYIAKRVEDGEMIFHRGVDIAFDLANSSEGERTEFMGDATWWNGLATQIVFLQNIPWIGDWACLLAVNLVVVDIPGGVWRIGESAFVRCSSLTTVSFPTTLTSIDEFAFEYCESLDNVDLLHTNLQELGQGAFGWCPELNSMTIPDSLNTFGVFAFHECSKLVPSNITVNDMTIDTTPDVVVHLRSQMSLNALLSGNNFLNTDDFSRLIVPYLTNDALMTIRLASKPWSRVVDGFIDDGIESGTMIVRGEEDIYINNFEERHMLVTRVVFLLNVTKVGVNACIYAFSLVVVDIPEGVESIGEQAFNSCQSLTTISFPTTLTSIGRESFYKCYSLENVDLLHTSLQELVYGAFAYCYELKSMKIPDSLQTLGDYVFSGCFKLDLPNIDTINDSNAVAAYLRSQQSPAK
ncbi:hypothetical protein TL16_g05455 [Triparma laevis f. inornata]|uniref:Surface antigen BspA-like n=1 Tax=Triparma laevis f. inornata TaxID=1714386 RepID=A0A9W7E998_9STRA|nr:hypothetical protein TL16_g05455 [Triparma laevis f. inornata]